MARPERFSRGGAAFIAFLTCLLGGAVMAWLMSRPAPPAPAPPSPEGPTWMGDMRRLIREGKAEEAHEQIRKALEKSPEIAVLHALMADCLHALGRHEAAIPHWEKAIEGEPQGRERYRLALADAWQRSYRPAEALKLLEQPFADPVLDRKRKVGLADVCFELGRYPEALRLLDSLPPDPDVLRIRYGVLSCSGREEEASRVLDQLDEKVAVFIRSTKLWEVGDFDGAVKVLRELAAKAPRGSPERHKARRREMAVCIESGDLDRLDALAGELIAGDDLQNRGDALASRAYGKLERGKRDEAKAAAKEFLEKIPAEYTPLRKERMMMRHVLGEVTDAELDAEAKAMSRLTANDLYWYLAIATGERRWGEKAAEATVGRNYPYHAIQRFLKR